MDDHANPDDPAGYLRRLFAGAPGISVTTRLYIDDAVKTYYNRAYLACTAMLGSRCRVYLYGRGARFRPMGWPGRRQSLLNFATV